MATAAPSLLASSVEKTNGAKLSRLLIDGGTQVLRNVFESYHPPAKLAADLNTSYSILNNLLRRRIINRPQWDQLFPPSGAQPDSNTFDITLLFLLLANICGLSPPSLGWHSAPPATDISLEANLARIKLFRNQLYGHVCTTGVDTPTFDILWQEISAVLVALGLDQAEIDRLKAENCGEKDHLDVLLEWADSEQEFKSQLKELRQFQTETGKDIAKVLQHQMEDRKTLGGNVAKLEEVYQIENETHHATEEVRQTQLEDHKTLQDSISKLERVSQTQIRTHQAVEQVHETLQAGLQEVKQEVEDLKRKRKMDRTDDLLRKLTMSEFKGDIEYHARRFQEGTREWIFKIVEDWLDDRTSPNRVMVVSGNAGTGKSVISAIISQKMQEAGRLSGSHFCQHNNLRYRKPQLILQSLACHLTYALPEYKNALMEQLSRNLGVELNDMGVEELFALLFKEPLSGVGDPERNILMVIDGLDESEYQGRNELLDVIANQFCKLPQWIRFFVTTRTEINIADSLKHLQPIELQEYQEENLKDLQIFFEIQLRYLRYEIEVEYKDVLLRKLLEKSEGVFLYAYFLVDFIKKNVSLLNPEQLESSLPLGISSVYLSHFKRLEKELCKELKIDEEQVLRFLCALAASREPLPVVFVSRMLFLRGRSLTAQRRVNKAVACISSLLPVRDGRLYFFHKSVKDWLTNTECYGHHDFIVDEKEGHEILFDLCANDMDNIKRDGVSNLHFSDTEKYALQHGVQHMIKVEDLGSRSRPWNIEELVNKYVTDLELIYARLCVNSTAPSDNLLGILKHVERISLSKDSLSVVTSLLGLLRKHSYILRDHPHLFFQCLLNEGCPELSSRAATVLANELPNVPYIKYLEKEERNEAVQARFYCSDTVACFDVSPEKDFMVCECRDGKVHLWSLKTGNLVWIRFSLMMREFHHGKAVGDAYRQIEKCLSYYRSVVFHPNGRYVLPGTLRNVYTLSGDWSDLFPRSNCTFSNCIFSGDEKKLLTDCPEKPKQIVLWSMENGEELNRIKWEEDIASFTISRDGTLIAISDYSGYVYLVDLQQDCRVGLLKYPDSAVCGLIHFTSDNNTLACGLLYSNSEKVDHDWYLVFTRRPRYTLLTSINELRQSTSSDCPEVTLTSGDFVLWPLEPRSLTEDDFVEQSASSCWVNNLNGVSPFLLAGFYFKVDNEIALIGSPAFKYVAAVNADRISEINSPSAGERITNVIFSPEGDTIYAISLEEPGASEVIVTVSRISSRERLMKRFFSGLVSVVPMKEGVILSVNQNVPELWNFELSECIRPLTKLTGDEELIPISNELVGCRRKSDGLLCLDQLFGLSFNATLELGDFSLSSIAFPDSLSYGRRESDFSSNTTAPSDVTSIPLVVDILDVANEAFVSSITTMGPGDEYTLSFACNKHQVVVCTSKETHAERQFWDEEIVAVSLWNNNSLAWRRSTVWFDRACVDPHLIFSPDDKFVVTWKCLREGLGIHILDAKTGETRHTFLEDHFDVVDCKFVVDGESLVCCVRDNFLRLFNIRSGDLLSMLDIEERPYSLGACVGQSLVAIGLWDRLKFVHVELPRVKGSEEKKG